ncbi:prepilin peptidase [Roseivivax sp. CAU 1761]
MEIPAPAALGLFLATLPVCFWVAWSDLARMKIPNAAVLALVALYALAGPLLLPPGPWSWGWLQLALLLAAGIALNAAGALGAGDAKFAAAAAAYVQPGDLGLVMALFAATLLAAYLAHRGARATPLRRLAPHWESWHSGRRFPMGLPLAGTLALYLALGARLGA